MRIILFILVIIFSTVLDLFLSREGINPLRPAYSIVPLFFAIFILRYNPKHYFRFLKTPASQFFAFSILLATIWSVFDQSNSEITLIEFTNAIISFFLYLFIFILFSKSTLKELRIVLLVSLSILILSLIYDTFIGLKPLSEDLRKGGFAENPNIAGSSIKFLGLCLILLYRKNKLLRIIFLICIIASVFLTFSRSGILGVSILLIMLLANNWEYKFAMKAKKLVITSAKLLLTLLVAYVTLVQVASYIQKEIPEFNHGDAGKRINILLGKESGAIVTRDDNLTYGRKNLLFIYLDKFMDKPLGYGTGYSADKTLNYKDTHNYYLKYAVNYGIIGLLVLLYFMYRSFKMAKKENNYYYLIWLFMFAAECLTSHSIFIEKPIIISLAFIDSSIFNPALNENKEEEIHDQVQDRT